MSGHAREVILSRAAIDDLREIGAYIARDNPERVDAFIDQLERRCRELGDRPLAWPALVHRRADGLRRRLYAGYLIFYRFDDRVVEVARIVHSARDYPALLFDD